MNELHDLNTEQRTAATSCSPSIVCLAGPGSGKTKTLVARCHHLISTGTSPERIALITYTNAAAREIEQRLQTPVGFVGTLHAWAARIIHNTELVLSPEQEAAMLADVVKEVGYKGSAVAIQQAFAAMRSTDIVARTMPEFVVKALLRRLAADGLTTMDLILVRALMRAETGDRLPFDHLLVDEFQDANAIDAAIYLAANIPNKFLVGDPDQSIFGFRGGSPQHLNDWHLHTPSRVLALCSNYRSSREVCEAANNLISYNPGRLHRTTRSVAAIPHGEGRVEVLAFKDGVEEVAEVARMLREATGSIAVLVRTNAEVDSWAEILREIGVETALKAEVTRPADWPVVMATVHCLARPGSMFAQAQLMRLKRGEAAAANALRLVRSGVNPEALNDPALAGPIPRPWDVSHSPTLFGFVWSLEARAQFHDAIARSSNVKTWLDVSLALARPPEPSETPDGVTVSTIHGAKGREWDDVILPGWDYDAAGKFATGERLEELRRVAYVAITRARRTVAITYCARRLSPYNRRLTQTRPSPFVAELNAINPQLA